MQKPTEFVREQVSTVRETVVTAAVEAGTVGSSVGSTVGEFIREQRAAAKVSLRELARNAGVSNPYLSQVERGLRKPSAEILAQIARGLKISAETLYEHAGILDRRSGSPETVAAILADSALSERHKSVLLELYETFSREHATTTAAAAPSAVLAPAPPAPSINAPRQSHPQEESA